MVDAREMIGVGAAAAGLLLLCSTLPEIETSPLSQPWRKDHLFPVAALAWSQTHCDSNLRIKAGTPGIETEDLLEISARFDEIEQQRGHAAACSSAAARITTVAEVDGSSVRSIASARAVQSP
jgi:hypothetical protein